MLDGDYYISKYNQEFNNLWTQFSGNELEREQAKAATVIQNKFRGNKANKAAIQKKKRNTNDPWGLE